MVGRMLDHRWLMKDRWLRMTYEGHLFTYDLWRTFDHIWLMKDACSHMNYEEPLLKYDLWRTRAHVWLIKNPCSCMTYEGPLLTYDLWRPCQIPPRWLDQQQSLCSAESLRFRDVQWCDQAQVATANLHLSPCPLTVPGLPYIPLVSSWKTALNLFLNHGYGS